MSLHVHSCDMFIVSERSPKSTGY